MRVIKAVSLILLFIAIGYFLYANIPLITNPSRANQGNHLLSTLWMGEGAFAKFTPEPESNTLGCWSTTISQIFYYHKLAPSGSAKYQCSKGYKIDENLDDYSYDWSSFANEITDSTSQQTIDQIARYCYSVATVLQKDFGTGRYITKLPPIERIEKQLNVDAKLYLVYNGLLHSKRKMRNIVVREIEANRPLYFYYRNIKVSGSGHSVVLDGYRFSDKGFYVHLNFGWGGRKDGWYELFSSIATEGDTQLRLFMTVKPVQSDL